MAKNNAQNLTLDCPVTYQIMVPGHLDVGGQDWLETMTVETVHNEAGVPVTILTGIVDQAALVGLLRRLYVMGLPLISVNYLEVV
jgi:hypothetical protein